MSSSKLLREALSINSPPCSTNTAKWSSKYRQRKKSLPIRKVRLRFTKGLRPWQKKSIAKQWLLQAGFKPLWMASTDRLLSSCTKSKHRIGATTSRTKNQKSASPLNSFRSLTSMKRTGPAAMIWCSSSKVLISKSIDIQRDIQIRRKTSKMWALSTM